MLTLARKEGEALILTVDGREITIVIHDIHGGQAKVSIEAPEDVKILREELIGKEEGSQASEDGHSSGKSFTEKMREYSDNVTPERMEELRNREMLEERRKLDGKIVQSIPSD